MNQFKNYDKKMIPLIKNAYEKKLLSWSGDANYQCGKGFWVSVEKLEQFIKFIKLNQFELLNDLIKNDDIKLKTNKKIIKKYLNE